MRVTYPWSITSTEDSGACQIRLGLLSWRNFLPADAKVRCLSFGPQELILQPWFQNLPIVRVLDSQDYDARNPSEVSGRNAFPWRTRCLRLTSKLFETR